MTLILAPMDGVIDHYMRETLTSVGGYDLCMSEFIRVTDRLLPTKVFYRDCPELRQGGKTKAGTPVVVQILGGIPEVVAENSALAVELGAPGVDINFGCPSKFVNRKAGGAVLLKEPDRVHNIVKASRAAVPNHIPVTGKIRLGYESTDLALDNARAVADAGASFLTVHARTKVDGYRAAVQWEWIGRIREEINIPVIANGDINSVDDYQRCLDITGCDSIMLGRGALGRPNLAQQIKAYQRGETIAELSFSEIKQLLLQMLLDNPEYRKEQTLVGRVKQWVTMMRKFQPEAEALFHEIKRCRDRESQLNILKHS